MCYHCVVILKLGLVLSKVVEGTLVGFGVFVLLTEHISALAGNFYKANLLGTGPANVGVSLKEKYWLDHGIVEATNGI